MFHIVLETEQTVCQMFSEGTRHDGMMLRMSGLLDKLEEHCKTLLGEPLCIYGDPAIH